MIWPTWNQQSWEYTYIYIHIYIYTYWKIIGLCFRYGGVPGTGKAKIIQIVSFLIGKPLWFGVPIYIKKQFFFGYGSNDLQWVQYNHRSCEYLCIASLQPTTSKSFAWGLWHWQIMYPFCFAMLGLFADSTQAIPSRPTSELIYDRLLPTQHGKNCQHAWHGPA